MYIDHPATDLRMSLDNLEFLFGKFAWLFQDGIRNSNLAQIMQVSSKTDLDRVRLGKFHLDAQQFGKLRNPPQVTACVGVAGFDDICHDQQVFIQVSIYGKLHQSEPRLPYTSILMKASFRTFLLKDAFTEEKNLEEIVDQHNDQTENKMTDQPTGECEHAAVIGHP